MKASLHESAPAKVNLFLRVLGQLPNGYHDLEMLNASLALRDEIYFEQGKAGSGIHFRVESQLARSLPPEALSLEQNLMGKAILACQDSMNISLDGSWVLHKNIPFGAGLGGGSADAAAVLRIVAKLFPHVQDKLSLLAAELGADVPYSYESMRHEHSLAYVRGKGERVRMLPASFLQDIPCLLILPDFPCFTPQVFRAFSNMQGSLPFPSAHWSEGEEDSIFPGTYGEVLEISENTLFPAASDAYPALREIHKTCVHALASDKVIFSGSGSTFVILPTDSSKEKDTARYNTWQEHMKKNLAQALDAAELRCEVVASAFL